jgi:hypothetical protein
MWYYAINKFVNNTPNLLPPTTTTGNMTVVALVKFSAEMWRWFVLELRRFVLGPVGLWL